MGVSGQCSRHGFAADWGGWGVVSVRAWVPSRNGEGWGWGGFPPPAAWHRVRVPSHPSRRKGRALRNTCHGELPWAREAMEKYGFFTKKRERERGRRRTTLPATTLQPSLGLLASSPSLRALQNGTAAGHGDAGRSGASPGTAPASSPEPWGIRAQSGNGAAGLTGLCISPVAGALWQRWGGVSAGRLLPRRAPHPRGAPQGPLPVCSGLAAWSGRGSGA